MQLDGLPFHQNRLKSLNSQAVQRGSAVQQNGVILNDFFEDVPNHRVLLLNQFLGLLDSGAVAALFQAVIDKRLEELQRHLFRKTALVQLQLRTDYDHRTAGIVDALAQQVLAETALFALQGVRQRLQRTIVRAAQHAAAPAVIEERVNGFLQHALFIAHDHIRSMQLHQLLQAVIAVDHPAIQVIEIGGRKPAAVQRNQRAKLRGNDGNDVQNHPFRLVAGFTKTLDDAKTLGVLQLLLR